MILNRPPAEKLATRAIKAAARVADLQAQLRDALLAGEETADVRTFLDEAATEVERVAKAQSAWIIEAEQVAEAHRRTIAEAIATGAVNHLSDQLAALELPATITENVMITAEPHHIVAIQTAAEQVANAGVAYEDAVSELQAAEATRAKIAGRIAEKHGARTAIVARRGAGDGRPADGADLALIAADVENLAQELAKADAVVASRQGPVRVAQNGVAIARAMVADVEREATESALLARAATLDSHMLDTVQRLEVARSGQPGRPKWGPSLDLRTALRRVSAQRGEL